MVRDVSSMFEYLFLNNKFGVTGLYDFSLSTIGEDDGVNTNQPIEFCQI